MDMRTAFHRLSRLPAFTAARLSALANTVLLLLALVSLPALAGYLLGGLGGALVAVGAAAISSFGATRYADRYILRAVGAQPLGPWDLPQLSALVRELSLRAGIPMPRLWLVPTDRANAFTVGRGPDSASIAVTSGLLRRLDHRGLAGVLAHEVAHIRHRDILLSSFAASVTALVASAGRILGLVVLLALPMFWLWAPEALVASALLLLAPIPALLLQAALSRQREYAADAEAARLTGDPMGLAAALATLELSHRHPLWWIFGWDPRSDSPLQSHPATEDRVVRLEALADSLRTWERFPGVGRSLSRGHACPGAWVERTPRPVEIVLLPSSWSSF
jgi:heat shock protein HtpX